LLQEFVVRNSLMTSVITAFILLSTLTLLPPPVAAQSAAGRSGAIRRTPDGKPDFSGVWAGAAFRHQAGPGDTDTPGITRIDPKLYSDWFRPGGKELFYQAWTGSLAHDDPQSLCLPVGFPRIALSPYAQQILETPGNVVIFYEYNHFFRIIPTDGRPHPKDVELTWMGDAVGKWEGDTLIVDTVGLKEWPLAADEPGRPGVVLYHSDALHVIERFTPTGPDTIAYQLTYDDPKIFTKPWTTNWQMKLHPTWKLYEQVCEENNRCEGGKCSASDAQK
jgi:hypothetical protein